MSPSPKLSTGTVNLFQTLPLTKQSPAKTDRDWERNHLIRTKEAGWLIYSEEHLFWENMENTRWLFQWLTRMAEGRGSTLQIDSPSILKSKIYLLSSKERRDHCFDLGCIPCCGFAWQWSLIFQSPYQRSVMSMTQRTSMFCVMVRGRWSEKQWMPLESQTTSS